MAITVTSAFNEFLKNSVNLDPNVSTIAKGSRDWLVDQVHASARKDTTFPTLYSEKDIFFGSFARKTKKRPLDDIDIMIGLHARGSSYQETANGIVITYSASSPELSALSHDNSPYLNSRKVINKFVALLNNIPQYEKAEIQRDQEAATLKLRTYDWNFDLVPCFFTAEDYLGRTYYLIPDGLGHWKKTDPRKDRDRIQSANTIHSGRVLDIIRILKYWNKRPTMPTMPSYMFENMILDYFLGVTQTVASQYIDIELPNLFAHIKAAVFCSVDDPKGIQGNLNNLTTSEKTKIWLRTEEDLKKAIDARALENAHDMAGSIKKWAEIFGLEFPKYG